MSKTFLYSIGLIALLLSACNSEPTVVEQETSDSIEDTVKEPTVEVPVVDEATPKANTLEIAEYETSVKPGYKLILTFPSTFGEVNSLADRGGYGFEEDKTQEGLGSYAVSGELYTVVLSTYNQWHIRSDQELFVITSIPIEAKNSESIPKTDTYLAEHEDRAYFVKTLTNDPSLVDGIPGVLATLEFKE